MQKKLHKKGIFKVAVSFLLCVLMLSGCSQTDGKKESGKDKNGTVLTDSQIGEIDGYSYELWKDRGDTTMTLTEDATFSCEWKNINNALFRRGKKYDCTKTYHEIGNIKFDYEIDYQPNGNSYFCVYGWMRDPLVEYYIVDSWGSWRPPGGNPIGTIEVDGGVYDIYKTMRVNQPSIDGTATFVQYWSVRQEKRTEGTINVSAHFSAWEALGMPMGKMYEAALTVEGYQSEGKATVIKNDITEGGEIIVPDLSGLPKPLEPDENGNLIVCGFEDGTSGWGGRGSAKASKNSSQKFSGESSLSVTGRSDSWNGAGIDLSTTDFKNGNAYRFEAMAMQNSADSAEFKLTITYVDKNGNTQYEGLATATGANGEWVSLSCESYVIPEGAWGLNVYVETASGKMDFFVDDAVFGVAE